MFGLGAYESSSDDEGKDKPERSSKVREQCFLVLQFDVYPISNSYPQDVEARTTRPKDETTRGEAGTGLLHNPPASNNEPVEPQVGPLRPQSSPSAFAQPSASGPSSPYSDSRNLVHNLTLPPVPNLDIPPSPPGSPNAAANQKISHFLSLKKQGVHFNEKLAASSSLKNPGLLQKLMDNAGVDEQTQYATALPTDLWDVSALPSWGFKEELQSSQQEVRRKIEEKRSAGQRESIDFVAGGGSGDSSRAGTPSGGKYQSSATEKAASNLGRSKESSGAMGKTGDRPRSPSSKAKTSRSR